MVSSVVQAVLAVENSHTVEQEASSSYREAANGFDTTHPTYPSWEEPDSVTGNATTQRKRETVKCNNSRPCPLPLND